MKSTIEDLGPCRKKMEITIPAQTLKEELEAGYREASRYAQVPGFRPGKVPRHILEKKYGAAIREHAGKELVEKSYRQALEEQEVDPLGEPKIEGLEGEEIDFDEDLTFQVTFDVHPRIELGDVRGIEVTREEIEIGAEELEKAMQGFARSRAEFRAVPGAEVTKEDRLLVDVEFRCDGETVKEEKEGLLLPGMPLPGTDPEEFTAKLLNRKPGEESLIPIDYPHDFSVRECQGRKGELRVGIREVQRLQVPELTDELAREAGYEEGLDQLREAVKERVLEHKKRLDRERQEGEVLTALMAQHPFDVPAGLVEKQVLADRARVKHDLLRQGHKKEEIAARMPSLEEEIRAGSEAEIKRFFLLKEVAKKEKIFVTEEEIQRTIQGMASVEKISPGEMRERLEKSDRLGELRMELVEAKVMDHLMQHARLVEKE